MTLPDNVIKVHVRCGLPVTVRDYAWCPLHGRLHCMREVVTRAYWLALEASIARQPPGRKLEGS